MHVAAANAAGAHADEDFVRLQHGHGKILDGELAIFFEDERFHGWNLYRPKSKVQRPMSKV